MQRMIPSFIILFYAGATLAGYVEERRPAADLAQKRQYAEALAAYMQLAAGDYNDFQKSDALQQAVAQALALKQYDTAKELADQIPMQQVQTTCRMRILMSQGEWQPLLDRFATEKIDAWPESLRAEAFALRGRAYADLKNGELAAGDLEQAVRYQTDPLWKCDALLQLGRVYQNLLQDDQKAIARYRAIQDLPRKDGSQSVSAILATAAVLQKQEKYDEAFEELARDDVNRLSGYWQIQWRLARAGIFVAQGNKEAAIAEHEQILRIKEISPQQKKLSEDAIRGLQDES